MSRQEFVELMNGGDCKEAYTAVEDYFNEAKKNRSVANRRKVFKTLEKCIEAHSDYHHPIQPLPAAHKQLDEAVKAAFTVKLRDYVGKRNAASEGELRKRFPEFLKGGGCKESSTAFIDCMKKDNSDDDDKCVEEVSKMVKCMCAHSDYYLGFEFEAAKEKFVKVTKAFFL